MYSYTGKNEKETSRNHKNRLTPQNGTINTWRVKIEGFFFQNSEKDTINHSQHYTSIEGKKFMQKQKYVTYRKIYIYLIKSNNFRQNFIELTYMQCKKDK